MSKSPCINTAYVDIKVIIMLNYIIMDKNKMAYKFVTGVLLDL